MLSLLLDENISPDVSVQMQRKHPNIPVVSVHHWKDGEFMAQADEIILIAAAAVAMTLVTYDQRTIPPILMRWGQAETDHGGIIFVDNRSIASDDIGALVRALHALWESTNAMDWTNSISYLKISV